MARSNQKKLGSKVLAAVIAVFLTCGLGATDEETGGYHAVSGSESNDTAPAKLPQWTPGMLDIHHISTGSGNCALFVFPDGTTMLFDAGDLDRTSIEKLAPLRVRDPKPNASRRAGEWITDYVRSYAPEVSSGRLDYAVISHFHSDHYGRVTKQSPMAQAGTYRLSGITDVAEGVQIGTLIDRAYPDYNIPLDLKDTDPSGTISNYISFVAYGASHGMVTERFVPGKLDQIHLKHSPAEYAKFHIRNLAANGEIWRGVGDTTKQFIPREQIEPESFNENPFSISLKVSYGAFAYYTGGDTTGLSGKGIPPWFDLESHLADVVGMVDVMSLNHHGNRDASNETFLSTLQPRVIVQQNWVSDQPGGEVLHRMISQALYEGPRDVFSTGTADETRVTLGPWMEQAYRSFAGHVVIRVQPGGKRYEVFVLDDTNLERSVLSHFGPYDSRGNRSE